ncbi:hypothetical protein L207DRAFT_529885 [Hyaloscypha variabilis F]|uniref:2EXR domain-containing protein n=1 Tax=Hyaloscypha variabilis (strain UAMH 11265 / GT02V1 / F) TaxID=1149755 RepID=A0A2J6RN87_HYAVF|nr:hypothetical protein L207DRAFT_529885 [Hyaloscypha variabilis F]
MKNLEVVGKALLECLDSQKYFDKAILEELKTMVQSNLSILREERKQTFPQFARLPPEIRVMIWKEAAKFSQVITPLELWQPKNSLPCSCPLLDVNEEAKHEAVRMRSEMYYSRYPEAHPDICAKSFAYIDFDVDILWVDGEFALKNFMSGEQRYGELRRLAFPYKEWLDGRCYWDFPRPELVILNMQLDELMFVVDWEEHIETGTAQVFELGPDTWFLRGIL